MSACRQLLLTTLGLGEYISCAILFEETLYQSTTDGTKCSYIFFSGQSELCRSHRNDVRRMLNPPWKILCRG
ncbi:hypothetical protein V6N13_069556 [Hibiscus sabdariffa]